MNERIQELAEQAGFDVERLMEPYPGGFPREDILALESFAELIVRECVIQCEQEWIRHGTHSVHNQAIHGCINRIKKQFGVE